MNSIPELVKLLERHLHEARNELTVCQYAVLSYVDDELRVTANKDEQERQELTARIAQLEAEIRNWQDCYCEFETIAPDGKLKISVLDIYNRIAELNARIAELEEAVGLITTLKPTMVMDTEHPLDMAKEVAEYVTARIAELEADSVQIQYVCEDELPEGISDEVFSAMYACSTVDFVRVYPYITIDGHKRFLIDFPEVQNA